jgi:Cys-tRNA(Pro)/Cys-tRNA(Cys) deacylase
MIKTNVMRILDRNKISYREYTYDAEKYISGIEVAQALNQDVQRVYKTIVTKTRNNYYVFMLPVDQELDLKKCAQAVNEKSIEMLPQKELLPLTGYVHGGCSPIGLKKPFPVIIDDSCLNQESIIFSGGKRGYQVELNLDDLKKVVNYKINKII